MAEYDIYGEPLRKGHCEVHPDIAEPYPCWLCIEEERAEISWLQCHEYEEAMRREYEEAMRQEQAETCAEATERVEETGQMDGCDAKGEASMAIAKCRICGKVFKPPEGLYVPPEGYDPSCCLRCNEKANANSGRRGWQATPRTNV